MPALPFIAREGELSRITAAWDGLAADGTGPVAVTCVGEAGIGKTRLLREAINAIAPATLLIGTARADGAAPHDWFAAATAAADPPDATDGRLWRVLRQEPLDTTVRLPDGALLRGAMRTLRRLVGDGPAVLAVDDLHWLDLESLALWSELAAAWDLPVLLLACSRAPEEAVHPEAAARTLARLAAIGAQVPLRPFTTAETGALVGVRTGGPVPRAAARAIHRRTGGNPFWITELAESGVHGEAPLPGHLGALLRARLAGEDRDVWRVARGLALLGERIDAAAATELLGEDLVADAVPRLVAAGVIIHDGATVRFPHALVREAFAATALPDEAQTLHRAALAAARSRGDDAAIALHAAAIGATGEAVAAAARTARRQLDSWLAESAQETAERALRLAPRHADLLDTAGQAALVNGDFDTARDHLHRFIDVAADDAVRCAAYLRLAEIAWHQGRIARQWAYLDLADALAAPGSAARARCLAGRAMALVRSEWFEPLPAVCDEAADLCERHGLVDAHRSVAVSRAMAVHRLGDPDRAVAALRQVWREAEADGDVRSLSRTVSNLLVIEMRRLAEPQAWQLFDSGLRAVGDLGTAVPGAKFNRIGGDTAMAFGDLDRALELLHAGARDEVDPHERAVLTAKAGLLAVERGTVERSAAADGDRIAAERLRDEALVLIPGMDQHWVITYAHWLAVAVAARYGDRADVTAALHAFRDAVPPDRHRRREGRVLDVARLALERGVDLDAVRRFLTACLGAVPATAADPSAALMWMTARAGRDDWAGVVGLLDTALAADLPVHRSIAHHLASGAHARLGDRAAATSHARQAVALLDRWPGWRRDQAEARLRRLESAAAPAALTARESEVLAAAAQGRSNRQIATALGISQRTVEVHMSRVLAKTGAAGRTELAAKYLRGDLM
jgi:DNA-binding CsgD family transcriptional regulator/tetratricopeptide (TPR) repeat protein